MGIRLNGTDAYLRHATARAAFNADEMSFLIWVRRPDGVSNAPFDRWANVGGGAEGSGWAIDTNEVHQISAGLYRNDGSRQGAFGSPTLTADMWFPVIIEIIQEAVTFRWYFNGPTQTGETVNVGRLSGARTLTIGSSDASPGSNLLEGDVAEIAIWNRALTSTERGNLVNGGSGGNGLNPTEIPTGLVSYWRCSDNTDLNDTISGFHLSASGSPASTGHPPVDAPAGGGPPTFLRRRIVAIKG